VQIRPNGGLAVTMDAVDLGETWVRMYRQSDMFSFVEESAIKVAYQSQPFYADINGDLE